MWFRMLQGRIVSPVLSTPCKTKQQRAMLLQTISEHARYRFQQPGVIQVQQWAKQCFTEASATGPLADCSAVSDSYAGARGSINTQQPRRSNRSVQQLAVSALPVASLQLCSMLTTKPRGC